MVVAHQCAPPCSHACQRTIDSGQPIFQIGCREASRHKVTVAATSVDTFFNQSETQAACLVTIRMCVQVSGGVRYRQRSEVSAEHASHTLNQEFVSMFAAQSLEFGHEVRLHLVNVPVRRTIAAFQHAHGGESRRHAHGGSIEGTRTYYSVGTQQLKDV
jgi:hypothetical protein